MKLQTLKSIIEKTYFEDGNMGKIGNKKNAILITKESDPQSYENLTGLGNTTIKISLRSFKLSGRSL